jgi:hypothetical protein
MSTFVGERTTRILVEMGSGLRHFSLNQRLSYFRQAISQPIIIGHDNNKPTLK